VVARYLRFQWLLTKNCTMKTTTNVYQVYFDLESNCVVMEWSGYATSSQFREGTELMLQSVKENKSTKVLADIRDMTIIGMEDQLWLEKDFLPRAIAAGFKILAIIWPISYFNKVAIETISYNVDREKLTISFFENQRSAKEYLSTI
jgi:hypothetical protein